MTRALLSARQIARRVAAEGLLDASEPYLNRVAKESLQELELATVQIFDRRGSERGRVRGGEPLGDDDAFPAGFLARQAALGGREQSLITQTWMGGLVRGIVPI